MNMPSAVYEKSKESISYAFNQRDDQLIEKETISVINLFAASIPNLFSNAVRFVGVRQPKYKVISSVTIEKEMIDALDVLNRSKDLGEIKLTFQKLFLKTTDDGYIDFDYHDPELLSVDQAASELGCSRQSIYNYLKKGLEYKEVNNVKKISKSTIELWKNPATAFELQWIFQENKKRRQTIEEKYDLVTKEINNFELDYGDTFEHLYGSLTGIEIDRLAEAADVYDWKGLFEKKKKLLEIKKGKKK